jgi:hypothetical protein
MHTKVRNENHQLVVVSIDAKLDMKIAND